MIRNRRIGQWGRSMEKKSAPGSQQLSMNLPPKVGVNSVGGSKHVTSLVDARTAGVREQAVKHVISSGIFSVSKIGEKK